MLPNNFLDTNLPQGAIFDGGSINIVLHHLVMSLLFRLDDFSDRLNKKIDLRMCPYNAALEKNVFIQQLPEGLCARDSMWVRDK